MLKVQNLRYGDILNEVNFEWRQGEIIALMGANGAGKSTLARILAGLIEPQGGEISLAIDGTNCAWKTIKRWQEIGLVGQHPRRQTIGATVAEELGYGLLNLGMDIHSVQTRVRELASSIGLGGKEDQSPATLSGGERQRLVTLAILAMQPSFIILDEALTMLDARAQANVLELLFHAQSKTGQLWITHDPELAYRADRLLVIKEGKVMDLGRPQEVFTNSEVLSCYSLQKIQSNSYSLAQNSSSSRTKDSRQALSDPLSKPVVEWRQTNYESRLRLNNVVKKGEFIGIVGPSGSGKTTLLESITGLILPNEGQMLMWGERVTKGDLNTLRRKTRLVLQEAGEYLIGRSVYDEIFYGDTKNVQDSVRKDRLLFIEGFGLPASLAEATPEHLSGGERQKVALAAAFRTRPEILLLDEPLLGLDVTTRLSIKAMISAWRDITILYVTHDLREVLEDADRLWLVEDGIVALDCSIENWQEHQAQFRAAGVRC